MGCGRVFERFHLPALRRTPEWSLVGVVDTSVERLRWAAVAWPGVSTGSSLASFLTDLRPDAVLISTPPVTHCALAIEALRGGAHVLVEKPMVLLPSEAELLLDLAGSAGRQIRVGFNRRFRPAYAELRRRLRTHPEAVHSVRFELCSDTRGWQSVSGYLGQPTRGGGLLEDIASHQLDLLPWVLGRDVFAVRARDVQHDAPGPLVTLDLRFSGELIATCLAGHQQRYRERLEVELDDSRWLAGPAGLVRAERLSPDIARRYLEARGTARAVAHRLLKRPSDTLETFRRQLVAWANALRWSDGDAEGLVGADGQAGASCVALVEACRQSLARDGAWIDTLATQGMTTP